MHTKTFNVYNQKNQVVQDAYSMLTANIHLGSGNKTIKTLVLSSCKPGVGKTAIAISLAVTMAASGWKVLLVDADMRKPADAKRLSDSSINGLSDYLMGEAELPEVLCRTNVANLTYISCGKNNTNPIGLLCSTRFMELMTRVRSEYDFAIFDTPALASVSDGSLVAAKADAALLAVEMGQTTLVTLKRAKEQLEKVNANLLGVVLNKVKKREYKRYFESYNYFFNVKRLIRKVRSDKSVAM